MAGLVIALIVSLLAAPAWAQDGDNPHQQASFCILNYWSGCDGVCLLCHGGADVVDDRTVCFDCHTRQGGPADHPVAVAYESARTALISHPQGPKLVCEKEGGPCKVQCSTCHNPHSSKLNLLRVDNQGSALCLSCHRK